MVKFAIIMPICNEELFLEEAIESVVTQTLNFEKNIQLILVNDGSLDNSEAICQVYKEKFPNNIIYIKTPNHGPSAARNLGLSFVSDQSKYIGFLDADDMFSRNTIECVNHFYENNNVHFVTIPVKYINEEGQQKDHSLNYRFANGDHVVNILDDYKAIQFYIGGVFIKRNAFIHDHFQFDETMRFWEDALAINMYLLKSHVYGVVSQATYFYRKHKNERSLVNRSWNSNNRYGPFIEHSYKKLIDLSIELYGEVIPYIQYLIIFHMKLYLFKKPSEFIVSNLSENERIEFIYCFLDVLQYVKEQYILELNTKHYYKEFLISLKRNGWPLKLEPISIHVIEEIIIKKKVFLGFGIKIIGYYQSEYQDLPDTAFISVQAGKKEFICTKKEVKSTLNIWDEKVRSFKNAGFEVILPLNRLNIQFILNNGAVRYPLNKINYYKKIFGKISHLFQVVQKRCRLR